MRSPGPDRVQPYGPGHDPIFRATGPSSRTLDDRALARTRTKTGTARLDGPRSGVDRAGVSAQRRLYAGAVLFTTSIRRATGLHRFVKTLVERGRPSRGTPSSSMGGPDVPDIEQAALPGAGGREHPPPAESPSAGCDAAAPVAGFRSGTSGHELAPRRAGEGRVF